MVNDRSVGQYVLLLLAAIVMPSLGCASMLGRVMTTSPNGWRLIGQRSLVDGPINEMLGIHRQLQISVGPPEAEIAAYVIEPSRETPPKGTILVVHGIYGRSIDMHRKAELLAMAGYRAVLVDLRGHGGSTGDTISYGVQESRDLVQVADELQRRGLLAGRLGVLGVSMGATTALLHAGQDSRVAAVVAVAPFSTMRDEVPDFIRGISPPLDWLLPDDAVEAAIEQAAARAQFHPDESDALVAVGKTEAPILFLHGTADRLVPPYHSQLLQRAASPKSRLKLLVGYGHLTSWLDWRGEAARETQAWFDAWLAGPVEPLPAE